MATCFRCNKASCLPCIAQSLTRTAWTQTKEGGCKDQLLRLPSEPRSVVWELFMGQVRPLQLMSRRSFSITTKHVASHHTTGCAWHGGKRGNSRSVSHLSNQDWVAYRMGENLDQVAHMPDWLCPACRNICNCSGVTCQRLSAFWLPTKQLEKEAVKLGFESVSTMALALCNGCLQHSVISGSPLCRS